jgi:hypothetical protein
VAGYLWIQGISRLKKATFLLNIWLKSLKPHDLTIEIVDYHGISRQNLRRTIDNSNLIKEIIFILYDIFILHFYIICIFILIQQRMKLLCLTYD